MFNLKSTHKKYIEDELIHCPNEEIMKYIEDNKESELHVIHSLIYYSDLDKINEILNELETKECMYRKYLLFVSEKGLGLEKFEYFLSKISEIEWKLAYDIIVEEKETNSYDCIKHLLDSNKIYYSEVMDNNIDFVNNLFLYDIERTFEVVKNNKFIMKILLENIKEMEESNEIEKYLIKNKIEDF